MFPIRFRNGGIQMTFKTAFIACLALSGCAHMHERVYSKIHIGDPSSKVTDLLGEPDIFQPSQRIEGATGWYYKTNSDICAFTIDKDAVAYMMCQTNPKRVSPAAVLAGALKGFSDGYNGANSRNISCTSTTLGATTQTNCN